MHGEIWQVLAAAYAVAAIMAGAVALNELPHNREFMAGKSAGVFVSTVLVGAVLWLPVAAHAGWQTLRQRWQGVGHA